MKATVALDGSDYSKLVTHTLKAFAPFDELVLLHAYHVPQLAYPGTGMSVGHDFSVRMEEALRQEGSRILEHVVSQLPEHIGPIKQILEPGPTAEVILTTADREKSDLIVMGSRGLGVIREQVLGSVTHRVMTHASCSTLIAKNETESFQNILVPLAQTTDAERIVSFLSKHPFRGTISLTLLHVIPFVQPILPVGTLLPESCQKELREGAEQFTRTIAAELAGHGYETSTIVKAGTPSIVIHEEAQRLQAHLILIGKQQRTTVSRFLMGSVSHSVVHHTTCSVLLVQ